MQVAEGQNHVQRAWRDGRELCGRLQGSDLHPVVEFRVGGQLRLVFLQPILNVLALGVRVPLGGVVVALIAKDGG